jgi:centriolar protein POC1
MNISRSAILEGHEHPIYSICNSQKTHIIFTGGGEAAVVEWSLKTMTHIKVLFKTPGSIYALHCPSSPNILIAGDRSGTITIFDFLQQKIVHQIRHHTKAVFQITSDLDSFFSVSEDGSLCQWSSKDFSLIHKKQVIDDSLRTIAISPDKKIMAIGGKDALVRVLDIQTFEYVHLIEGHTMGIFSLCFSPDGKYLLSSSRDAQLKIWNVNDHFSLRENIPAHLFSINDITFLGDQKYFATASRDKSIKIWNIEDLQLYKIISLEKLNEGHRLSVNKIIFNSFNNLPAGRQGQLVSVSDDKMVMVWSIS